MNRPAGVHASCTVHQDANVSADLTMGPKGRIEANATVEEQVVLGDGVTIEAGARIGRGALIGDGAHIGPGATLGRGSVLRSDSLRAAFVGAGAVVKDSVVLAPGTRIGSEAVIRTGALVGRRGTIGQGALVAAHSRLPEGVVVDRDQEAGRSERPWVDPEANVTATAVVQGGARIEADAWIGCGTLVGTESRIESGSRIGADCVLGPGCRIGSNVMLGVGTVARSTVDRPVTVRSGAWVLDGTTLEAGVTVGNRARVGPGSRIQQDQEVPDGTSVTAREADPRPGQRSFRVAIGDFSRHPGPRRREQGPSSGQAFREEMLRPALEAAVHNGDKLIIELRGTRYGCPIGFLEEATGGLVRDWGPVIVRRHVELEADDLGTLAEADSLMQEALQEAETGSRTPMSGASANPLEGRAERVPIWIARGYALHKRGQEGRKPDADALYDALETLGARHPTWNWGLMAEWVLLKESGLWQAAKEKAAREGLQPGRWPWYHVDWQAAGRALANEMAMIDWNGIRWWLWPSDPVAKATGTVSGNRQWNADRGFRSSYETPRTQPRKEKAEQAGQ